MNLADWVDPWNQIPSRIASEAPYSVIRDVLATHLPEDVLTGLSARLRAILGFSQYRPLKREIIFPIFL